MSKDSEKKLVDTEAEISIDGVGHSDAGSVGEDSSSPTELSAELAAKDLIIQELIRQNEELKAKGTKVSPESESPSGLDKLADAIISSIEKATLTKAQPGPVVDVDNINRTSMFQERLNIDGRSMTEARAAQGIFRREPKEAISIPKTFQNQFGPTLVVSVNGVRVAIPCDGKTYMINETHALHARERIAKVDKLIEDKDPQVVEINA